MITPGVPAERNALVGVWVLDEGYQITGLLFRVNGRRHLFWVKNYQILSEWASEQRPIPCEGPVSVDLRLMNTGVSLSTTIPPDDTTHE